MKDLVKLAQSGHHPVPVAMQDHIPGDTLRHIAKELDLPETTIMSRYYKGARGYELIRPREPNWRYMARLMGVPWGTFKRLTKNGASPEDALITGRLRIG